MDGLIIGNILKEKLVSSRRISPKRFALLRVTHFFIISVRFMAELGKYKKFAKVFREP